jgi:lethal(3)malignant brain tumor-like protein
VIFIKHFVYCMSFSIAGYGYIDSTNRCGIIGCRGISNTKHVTQNGHNCLDECPYEIKNWTKTSRKVDRLKSKPILHKSYRPTIRAPSESSNSGDSPPLIRKRIHHIQPFEGNLVEIPDHPDQKRIRRISNADFELDGDRKDFVLTIGEPEKTTDETARRLVVSKDYLADYGPRLVEAHNLWTANSKMFDIIYDENRGLLAKNPVEWSVEEVVTYIGKLPSCAEAAVKFEEESVDGASLLCLTQDDLIKFFEVKLGPAIKIYNRIIALREHINVHFLEK